MLRSAESEPRVSRIAPCSAPAHAIVHAERCHVGVPNPEWLPRHVSGRRFDDRQWTGGDPQARPLDDVDGRQVASTKPGSGTAPATSIAWHGDFDYVGREPGQTVPPCGCQSAGDGGRTITPNRHADTRRVGERSVVDEVDAAGTLTPTTRPNTSVDRVLAQPSSTCLFQREHPVVPTEKVIEHISNDASVPSSVPSAAISVWLVALDATDYTEITGH